MRTAQSVPVPRSRSAHPCAHGRHARPDRGAACWAKPTNSTQDDYATIWLNEQDTGLSNYKMSAYWPDAGGSSKFRLETNGPGYPNAPVATFDWTVGVWYFVSGSFDHARGIYNIYVNGQFEDSEATTTQVIQYTNNMENIYFGSRSDGGESFTGHLAECRVHNRALSAGEHLQLYRASLNGSRGLWLTESGKQSWRGWRSYRTSPPISYPTKYPIKNTEHIFSVALTSQSTGLLQSNPTLADNDVQVSKDGGTFTKLTNLPTVSPAGGTQVEVVLTADEMDADAVGVLFQDQAGAEWSDQFVEIQTSDKIGGEVKAGATTTVFSTTLSEATDDHFNNMFVHFVDGNLAGQCRKISDYSGADRTITVATAFTDTPAAHDHFIILARSE